MLEREGADLVKKVDPVDALERIERYADPDADWTFPLTAMQNIRHMARQGLGRCTGEGCPVSCEPKPKDPFREHFRTCNRCDASGDIPKLCDKGIDLLADYARSLRCSVCNGGGNKGYIVGGFRGMSDPPTRPYKPACDHCKGTGMEPK